jgi:hypothetical protein
MVSPRSDARLIAKNFERGGLRATTEFNGEPKPGDIMLAGNGGSVFSMLSDTTRR